MNGVFIYEKQEEVGNPKTAREMAERIAWEYYQRQFLVENKHFHDFGYDHRCKCGTTKVDYYCEGGPGSNQPICPMASDDVTKEAALRYTNSPTPTQ